MRRIKRLSGIPSEVVHALEKKSMITCKDVLGKPLIDIVEQVGITASEAELVVQKAASVVAPTPVTVQHLIGPRDTHGHERFLATSISPLDECLRGGLLKGTITEIVGPSGCGKTQFCTMLAVLAAMPIKDGGTDKRVLYIDTEGAFSAERLVQIARHVCGIDSKLLLQTADRISVVVESDSDSLLSRLKDLEETLIRESVGLIIIDSIASHCRKEFGRGSNGSRSDLLATEAAILKYIAEVFKIPILVTNQVTTKMEELDANESNSYVTAALGNSWSHSVNTRLVLQYTQWTKERTITIVKSPLAPTMTCPVRIDEAGVVAMGQMKAAASIVTIEPHILVRSSGPSTGNSDAHAPHSIMLAQQ